MENQEHKSIQFFITWKVTTLQVTGKPKMSQLKLQKYQKNHRYLSSLRGVFVSNVKKKTQKKLVKRLRKTCETFQNSIPDIST